MSETATPETVTESAVTSTSVLNLAIEAIMDLIDQMNNFSSIFRGALGTDYGLCCEIVPTAPESVFMDKNSYTPVTLAINGKHHDLRTLSDTLNNICDSLPRMRSYPSGNGWEIVDITAGAMPQIIGRETNNDYLMSCDIVIKLYRKDDTPNESELGE